MGDGGGAIVSPAVSPCADPAPAPVDRPRVLGPARRRIPPGDTLRLAACPLDTPSAREVSRQPPSASPPSRGQTSSPQIGEAEDSPRGHATKLLVPSRRLRFARFAHGVASAPLSPIRDGSVLRLSRRGVGPARHRRAGRGVGDRAPGAPPRRRSGAPSRRDERPARGPPAPRRRARTCRAFGADRGGVRAAGGTGAVAGFRALPAAHAETLRSRRADSRSLAAADTPSSVPIDGSLSVLARGPWRRSGRSAGARARGAAGGAAAGVDRGGRAGAGRRLSGQVLGRPRLALADGAGGARSALRRRPARSGRVAAAAFGAHLAGALGGRHRRPLRGAARRRPSLRPDPAARRLRPDGGQHRGRGAAVAAPGADDRPTRPGRRVRHAGAGVHGRAQRRRSRRLPVPARRRTRRGHPPPSLAVALARSPGGVAGVGCGLDRRPLPHRRRAAARPLPARLDRAVRGRGPAREAVARRRREPAVGAPGGRGGRLRAAPARRPGRRRRLRSGGVGDVRPAGRRLLRPGGGPRRPVRARSARRGDDLRSARGPRVGSREDGEPGVSRDPGPVGRRTGRRRLAGLAACREAGALGDARRRRAGPLPAARLRLDAGRARSALGGPGAGALGPGGSGGRAGGAGARGAARVRGRPGGVRRGGHAPRQPGPAAGARSCLALGGLRDRGAVAARAAAAAAGAGVDHAGARGGGARRGAPAAERRDSGLPDRRPADRQLAALGIRRSDGRDAGGRTAVARGRRVPGRRDLGVRRRGVLLRPRHSGGVAGVRRLEPPPTARRLGSARVGHPGGGVAPARWRLAGSGSAVGTARVLARGAGADRARRLPDAGGPGGGREPGVGRPPRRRHPDPQLAAVVLRRADRPAPARGRARRARRRPPVAARCARRRAGADLRARDARGAPALPRLRPDGR